MTQGLNWEKIDVPRGAFIGWGLRAGQTVTGVVVEFAPTGGTDFNGNVCPNMALDLVEEAWSADKAQNWSKHQAGDLVQLNCGQVSLKRAVHAADPSPGDLVKVELENILSGAGKNGGDVKEFGIQIVRGFRPVQRRSAPPASSQPQQAQPNFGAPQQAPPQQQVTGAQFNGGGPQYAPPQYQPPQYAPQQQPQFSGQQQPSPAFAAPTPQGDPWGAPAPSAPMAPAPGPSFGTGTDAPPF